MESRGKDAAGIGWIHEQTLRYIKYPVPARQLAAVLGKQGNRFWPQEMPEGMILHARAQTMGSPKNPRNNHPVIAKDPKVVGVVHNGIISTPGYYIGQFKVKRVAEVDTEALAIALSVGIEATGSWQGALTFVEKLQGSAAFAAISPWVDGILLARAESSPLVLGFDRKNKVVWWASEQWMLPTNYTKEAFGLGWEHCPAFRHSHEKEAFVVNDAGITRCTFKGFEKHTQQSWQVQHKPHPDETHTSPAGTGIWKDGTYTWIPRGGAEQVDQTDEIKRLAIVKASDDATISRKSYEAWDLIHKESMALAGNKS